MTLTAQLKEFADNSVKRHPGAAQDIMKKAIDALKATPILEHAYKTGDSLPQATLPNATGKDIVLHELLKEGKLVIAFYRGGWCPYCNIELRALQNALPEIKAKGAQLIAVSPEAPDNSLTTTEKNTLDFEVLSDHGNTFARSLNLVYELPDELVNLYKTFGIDLDHSQGGVGVNELPIAATYIVEQDGTISYHFLEEDYKLRADPKDILKQL